MAGLTMRIVVFGLSVSSSWGNGHATLWRALIKALGDRGHHVAFFERDVPYYAQHRDLTTLEGHDLRLYAAWSDVRADAARCVREADVALVTSYCPDAAAASALVGDAPRVTRVFYDLDTPVTLSRLDAGEPVDYVPPGGFEGYDLVLSYTGGGALDALRTRLGARVAKPLYGSVDPGVHRPDAPREAYRADLSYLGTYAEDRQATLDALFLRPARLLPEKRFLIGGSQYPDSFAWARNIHYIHHVPPPDHPAFFGSCGLTLNVTRQAMAAMGWCPSGRLFEAAACGAPILSDWWEGLDAFFEPGRELLVARTTDEALAALDRSADERRALAAHARARVLASHTAAHRARDFEDALAGLSGASSPHRAAASVTA
jgi:spore maturation protein CgeB